VILDESHCIKDPNSQRSRLLKPTLESARRVVMLSGTPALNKPIELHNQVRRRLWVHRVAAEMCELLIRVVFFGAPDPVSKGLGRARDPIELL
jgi:hypothetical protein